MDRWFGGGGVRTRQNGNYIFLAEAGLEPLREVAPDEVRIGITMWLLCDYYVITM